MKDLLTLSGADVRRRLATLEGLLPGRMPALLEAGQRRSYASGTTVLRRGSPATTICVLLKGRARVLTLTPQGDEQLLRWMEVGEVTGLSCLIAENVPFPTDLIADGPIEMLHITPQALIEMILKDAELGLALLRMQCLRVTELIDILTLRALDDMEDKVHAALQRMAPINGRRVADGIELRISQADIASASGVSRQRVNLHLQQLQSRGVLRLGYRHLVLLRTPAFWGP